MHHAQWQYQQQSGSESSPSLLQHSVDEIESGQRLRVPRSKQQRQRRTVRAVQPAVTRQLRSHTLLRSRLLRLLLVALGAVLLLLFFLVVVFPAWRQSSATDNSAGAAVSRAALRRVGILSEQLPDELYTDAAALQRLLTFYTADHNESVEGTAVAEMGGLLVVHVAHGLSNRVRTFASALLFAHHFHLALRLIWVPDHHCRATFTQLISLPNTTDSAQPTDASYSRVYPTWRRFRMDHLCEREECTVAARLLSDERFDIYRYIDTTGQALDYRPAVLVPKAGRSVYVHASTRFNHSLGSRGSSGSMNHLWPALSALAPAEAVSALLAAFDRQYPAVQLDRALGLHIRQLQPVSEIAGLQQHEYTPAMWAGLAAARRLSGFDYFEQLVNTTVSADPEQLFYVAADSPAAVQQLQRQFGQHRFLSVRDVAPPSAAVCDGSERGVACVQLALADQLLLARCGWIHGSVWSSFSELAGMWRMAPVLYPPGAQQQVRAAADNVSRTDSVADE